MLFSNDKGVLLLHIVYKAFTTLLMDRISPYVTDILGEYRYEFKRENQLTVTSIPSDN